MTDHQIDLVEIPRETGCKGLPDSRTWTEAKDGATICGRLLLVKLPRRLPSHGLHEQRHHDQPGYESEYPSARSVCKHLEHGPPSGGSGGACGQDGRPARAEARRSQRSP